MSDASTQAVDSMSKFDLNNHVVHLLIKEPFWAALSRHLNKIACQNIPTAGVRVSDDGRFELIYNPVFMARMVKECAEAGNSDAYKWVTGILKHEFMHLILGHCSYRRPTEMTKRDNIAMDLAINTHLEGQLPPLACMPGVGPFKDLPPGLPYEGYLRLLPEQSGNEGGEGEAGDGEGQFDDHSQWSGGGDEGSAAAAEVARHRLKDAVKRAHNEANAKGWGSVSVSTREIIEDFISTKVDWRKVLRSFVRASIRASRRSTVRRINKRFPYIHAGKRSERMARLAIPIDQSGSVGNDLLAAFFSELQKLSDLVEFTIIPFDTQVDPELVFVWKKGEKRPMERVMYGGTCFNAPTEYINAHNFDGCIFLTDMEAPKPITSKCQRMWMTNSRGVKNSFETSERIIEVTD